MRDRLACSTGVVTLFLATCSTILHAQTPRDIVQRAVNTEIAASRNDHSLWRYQQEEKLPIQTLSIVVQTSHGSIKQKLQQDGKPLTSDQEAAEMKRIESFVHDPGQQEKQKRDSEHDDASAAKLLAILPNAYSWKIASETSEVIVLAFQPDAGFAPPDIESHVMGTMAGQLIVDRAQHRIRSIRGSLSEDVSIGYGFLGKLRQGGTFDVERRELMPGLWQIVETHVHIDGKALLFKTIGQQQDEINSDFTRVPESTTLEQAVKLLRDHKE